MSEYHPILEVSPDWVLDQEPMGGKAKFWFRIPEMGETKFLFKYPRQNTGEHWAEKVADEVARLLDIPHATVGLATFQGTRGSASKSFVGDDQQLWHGNQILSDVYGDYDLSLKFHQYKHTLRKILHAFDHVFEEPAIANEAKRIFAQYVVLDAIVGNIDRHHENWGIVRHRAEDGRWVGHLAWSFDHASSLGRELTDKRREGLLANNRIGNYSEKGSGGIYWSESDSKAPSPLELVRLAYQENPSLFVIVLSKLERLDELALMGIIEPIPDDWMSDAARRFAVRLIRYNCQMLREIM